jgi:hypothetical protein
MQRRKIMITEFRNLTRQEATICIAKALDVIKEDRSTWFQGNWHSVVGEDGNRIPVDPDQENGFCGTAHCLAGHAQIIARDLYGIPFVILNWDGYIKLFALTEIEGGIFAGGNDLYDLERQVCELRQRPEPDHTYDLLGLDRDGFDRGGWDEDGLDRDGFDQFGRDGGGYDREGFDEEGRDRDGYDADGWDYEGFDSSGFNSEGRNYLGLDRDGSDTEG